MRAVSDRHLPCNAADQIGHLVVKAVGQDGIGSIGNRITNNARLGDARQPSCFTQPSLQLWIEANALHWFLIVSQSVAICITLPPARPSKASLAHPFYLTRQASVNPPMALANPIPPNAQNAVWVIRPSWASLGRWELHILPLAAIGLVLGIAKGMRNVHSLLGLFAGLAVVGVSLGVYALWITAYMMGTSISVSGDAIVVTHWFRSKATVPVGEIARVIRCTVDLDRVVFAFASTGRCVMSLHASRWDDADLDRIWARIGVRPEGSWSDTVQQLDLNTRFPGAF